MLGVQRVVGVLVEMAEDDKLAMLRVDDEGREFRRSFQTRASSKIIITK